MRYKNYLWDFDGTLFDSYPHSLAAAHEVMEKYGIEHDIDELNALQVRSFLEMKAHYRLTDEVYNELWNRLHSWSLRPAVTLYPHAAAVLRAICEAGGKNYLYTHRNYTAWTYLKLYGLDKYFSGKVDREMRFPLKPAPDAVNYLCDHYALNKADTVMVGDREIDIQAGVNGGTAGCLFVSHEVDTANTAASHVVYGMLELAKELEIPLSAGDILTAEAAETLRAQASAAAQELCAQAKLISGQLAVVGCSTSEVSGERIGSSSSPEVAAAVFAGVKEVLDAHGIALAAQCCEHLNRALIIERSEAIRRGYEILNVVPMPKAGGSFATQAWQHMEDPVAVSEIKADAGLDIGGTLIGMHLKRVAVPLRLNTNRIGHATLAAARVRPPFAGGERAVYSDELM